MLEPPLRAYMYHNSATWEYCMCLESQWPVDLTELSRSERLWKSRQYFFVILRVSFPEEVFDVQLIFLPSRVLNFGLESSRYGLLNFKCLMTNHVTFETQLEHVFMSRARNSKNNDVTWKSTVPSGIGLLGNVLEIAVKVKVISIPSFIFSLLFYQWAFRVRTLQIGTFILECCAIYIVM